MNCPVSLRFRNTRHKGLLRSATPDGEGRVAVGELEEGTAAMLEHIAPAALPLIHLLAGAPHPLVVGEGFGCLDEGGAVSGAHVGRQVLQPRGLQVLALRHVQAVLAVLHTQVRTGGSSFVDPDSMRSLDPCPDSQSGSGSKRVKMA